MNEVQSRRRSHLFMLRLWAEDLGDSRVEWRGSVQNVTAGETHYFRDWSELIEYLQAMLPRLDNEAMSDE